MKLRDKYGWPVETITTRPVFNLLRLIIHTSVLKTWKYRKQTDAQPKRPHQECECNYNDLF